MKIQSVQGYRLTNKKQNQVQGNPLLTNSNVGKDTFKPSFGMEITSTVRNGNKWDRWALKNIWDRSGGLRDLAESFHKESQSTIKEIGRVVSDSVYKSEQVTKFFGLIEKTIQVTDYDATSKVIAENTNKLSSEITSVIQDKNRMTKEISQLELRMKRGISGNDSKKLEELKANVKKLDDKADRVKNDYWEDEWESTETSYTGTSSSDPNYFYTP